MERFKWFSVLFVFFYLNSFSQYTIREADTDFKSGLYHVALKKYLKLYDTEYENIKLNYNIGLCYLYTNLNKKEAISYLEFVKNQNDKNNYIYFDLGLAYHYNHEFEKAIEMFEQFVLEGSNDNETVALANHHIRMCQNGMNYIQNPLNVSLINLDNKINSEKSEYTPYISDDGANLFFTTDDKYMGSYGTYINNIEATTLSGSNWKRPRSVGSKVNTMEDEILSGYSSSNNILIARLYRWEVFEDIYLFDMKNISARSMIDPGPNINSGDHESGACLSSTGDTLFFSSNRPDGFGGFDIYMSKKLPDGLWGIPVNLGPTINTEYDEDYPSITQNGKTLYYASNNEASIGGLDIFFSKLGRNNEWSRPRNMGYPINDAYDNYNISITSNGRHGYIALNKEDGIGEYDIYKVIFNDKDPTINIRKGKVFLINKDTIPFNKVDTTLVIKAINKSSKTIFGEYKINKKNSDYVIAMPPGSYLLEIKKEGYAEYKEIVVIKDKHKDQNKLIKKNIYLRKQE
jgi:tetratricopeptide (TPR) repeat protein